jgi:acylphosphatase
MRKRVVAHGRVQGVFFRDSTRERAQAAGVAGWVTNRPDGAVEAVFEGEDAAVARMVDWMRSGPSGASVERTEVSEEEPSEDLASFEIR